MASPLSDASRSTTRSLLGLISIPNILSLDAPLVAIGWQWLIVVAFPNPASATADVPANHASVMPASIPSGSFPHAPAVVLFITVWLIYMADRLMDCRRMDFSQKAPLRHRFAKRWSKLLWPLWGAMLITGGLVAILYVHRELLAAGAILLVFVLAYSGAVHFCQSLRNALPKEFIVGSLFAIGVSLPVLTSHLTLSLVIAIGVLAALFVLNCLCVAKAQRASDRQQGIGSAILMYPGLATRLPWFASMLAAASAGLGAGGWIPVSIATTTSLSSMMLIPIAWSMDHETGGMTASQWGQLADYALLSPFLAMAIAT
ncbi:hypothetical protein Pla52o_07830 [Novipirellula galeiformis]|uniref:Prenyltransferase n=1 Tax=Novipirellula galeiformis TaxID=2528004 RepID=A0A5C6CTV1_9BACT|nr:hypothetical protein [Novipirellula galeiformis]TWU26927.1 hypothetical protein Pla52o_07830 [Novipirellula galeiformis]